MKRFSTREMAVAGLIGALYVTLCLVLYPFSFGPVQLRVSEALTLLPVVTPAAVPGLFVGCLIANLFSPGAGLPDIVFGSLATLAAALLSRKLRAHPVWAALPPVVINGVVVGLVLHYTLGFPLLETMLTVSAGQAIACYGLGLALLWALKRLPERYKKWMDVGRPEG